MHVGVPWGVPGGPWGPWGALGGPWGSSGSSLGVPGRSLGGPGAAHGSLGGPWESPGCPQEVPGRSLGVPGRRLVHHILYMYSSRDQSTMYIVISGSKEAISTNLYSTKRNHIRIMKFNSRQTKPNQITSHIDYIYIARGEQPREACILCTESVLGSLTHFANV